MNEKTGRDPLFPDARGEASAHVSPTESYLVDIPFSFGSAVFHLLKLSRGWVTRQDFSHSHGSRNYEIHYIPAGKGEAFIEHTSYAVTPNTLYVTGPHIEQIGRASCRERV